MKDLKYKIEIIENFLDIEDYNNLCSIKLENKLTNGISIYHNRIDKNGNIIQSCIKPEFLKLLNNKYHKRALKILEKLCPQKLNLYDYSDFTITHTSKEYKSSFHDDTPDKILSGVIYLYPDKNTGTIFSNEKNIKNSQTILWKRNKAVFFSREERKTWHAYKGDGASDRIVLVYNLYTKNIKKVFEIEKKNYFIGSIRHKINPFIFKYLKVTI